MTNEDYPSGREVMPTNGRIRAAATVLVALILAAGVGLGVAAITVGFGPEGEFRGGIEPMTPAGPVGSGLHLPLGGR